MLAAKCQNVRRNATKFAPKVVNIYKLLQILNLGQVGSIQPRITINKHIHIDRGIWKFASANICLSN